MLTGVCSLEELNSLHSIEPKSGTPAVAFRTAVYRQRAA